MNKQTKLTKHEKRQTRTVLSDFENAGGVVISLPDWGVTVALAPSFEGSRTARLALALCSPTENKFRKLVGIARALAYHYEGTQTVAIALPAEFWKMGQTERAHVLRATAEEFGASAGF